MLLQSPTSVSCNVGGLPEDMQFELIEPLNTLYRMKFVLLVLNLVCQTTSYGANHSQDQVCHPVMGEITEEKLETVRESDAILREEIAADFYVLGNTIGALCGFA